MRTRSRLLLVACVLCASPAVGQTLLDPDLQLEVFASGLDRPVAMDWLAPNDILVVERETAAVRRIQNGVLLPSAVYQQPGGGDDFLLGIAINTEDPPAVFLFVEDQTGAAGNRVLRLDWNPSTGQLENATTIIATEPSGAAANQDDGGKLLLGPPDAPGDSAGVGDGQLLYVVSGYSQVPGQLRNDPGGTPPDDLGVILRVLQDGSAAPGNPFTPYCSVTTATTCDEDADCPGGESCKTKVASYWSYGLRNSFGIALDPVTGDLWSEENGEDDYDELNRVVAGMNSGWSAVMGPDPGGTTLWNLPGGASIYRDPEYSWVTPTGPTGVVSPSGSHLGPSYDDKLLFADFNPPSQIYAMPLNASRTGFELGDLLAETQAELDAFAIATSFGGRAVALELGPDRALYVVSIFNGTIYRITGPPHVPALGARGVAALVAIMLAAAALTLRTRAPGESRSL